MSMMNANTHRCQRTSPLRKWLLARRVRKLQLDDNQMEQLDTLFARAWSVSRRNMTGGNELLDSIGKVLQEQAFDHDRVAERMDAAARAYAEDAAAIVIAFGEFYHALRPWQQQELRALWRKRSQHARRCFD